MNILHLFFIFILLFIAMLYCLIKGIRRLSNAHRIIKVCICLSSITLYVLFSFFLYKIFMSDFRKPSTVDIFPFSEISNADFSDLDAVTNKLRQSMMMLGEDFEMANVPEPSLSCEYDYRKSDSSTSVSIYLFDDAELAKDYFDDLNLRLESDKNEGYIKGSAGVYIKNSESIEAILGDSYITRSVGSLYVLRGSDAERIIGTSVRVNNLYVKFMESGNNDGKTGQLTNEAIINLCEVLAEFIK